MTFHFPSYWKETLKTFSNREPEVCSKMHLPSCKVEQSQSTESEKGFLLLSSLSYYFILSVLKDGGKTGGQKVWSIC